MFRRAKGVFIMFWKVQSIAVISRDRWKVRTKYRHKEEACLLCVEELSAEQIIVSVEGAEQFSEKSELSAGTAETT